MNVFVPVLALVALLLCVSDASAQQQLGRYQLIEMREPLVPGGAHTVLRIDTATG